jgi:hypothetical protein
LINLGWFLCRRNCPRNQATVACRDKRGNGYNAPTRSPGGSHAPQEKALFRELHEPFLDFIFPPDGTLISLAIRRSLCTKSFQRLPNIAQKVLAGVGIFFLPIPGFWCDLLKFDSNQL